MRPMMSGRGACPRTLGATVLVGVALGGWTVARAEQATRVQFGNDVYTAGCPVVVADDVAGDLVAAGCNVSVTGNVGEDAIIAGGMVNLTGNVREALRVAGGTVTVAGNVGGHLIGAGGTIHLLPGSSVQGDVVLTGGELIVDGTVAGPLRLQSGNARINGTVEGPVTVKAATLEVGDSAVLKKGVDYATSAPIKVATAAQVMGEMRQLPGALPKAGLRGAATGVVTTLSIAKLLSLMLAALVAIWVFPRFSQSLTRESLTHFGRDLVVGLGALVVVPIVALVLLFTLVGLPLGILGGLTYAGVLIVARICAAIVLGALAWRLVTKEKEYRADWRVAVVGVLLLAVIGWIPFFGGLVSFVLLLAVLGAIAMMTFHAVTVAARGGAPASV